MDKSKRQKMIAHVEE
jgi:hypothetical protein